MDQDLSFFKTLLTSLDSAQDYVIIRNIQFKVLSVDAMKNCILGYNAVQSGEMNWHSEEHITSVFRADE
jgi:hypothetical protein